MEYQSHLRNHHEKNLSSLQFRPSYLHLPSEIRLRYPWLPQSPIYLQYDQVFHTKNAQEALHQYSKRYSHKKLSIDPQKGLSTRDHCYLIYTFIL
jgi:hypothetical protein